MSLEDPRIRLRQQQHPSEHTQVEAIPLQVIVKVTINSFGLLFFTLDPFYVINDVLPPRLSVNLLLPTVLSPHPS